MIRRPSLCWSTILDLVAPPRCVECDVQGALGGLQNESPFCLACFRDLPWWRRIDGCPRCGTRPWKAHGEEDERGDLADPFAGSAGACAGCLSGGSPLHSCHTLLRYEGSVRRWVPAVKRPIGFRRPFGPAPPILRAIDALTDQLAEQIRRDIESGIDLVLSIPLHPRRLRERGFNHVDPIARRIATRLDLPWQADGLERARMTEPQASLSGPARIRNVRGAFVYPRRFDGEVRIALVDDVLTTGSTLEAAADALLEAGALEVHAVTLAATLPTRPIDRRPARRANPGCAAAIP